jgi:hypothetical protein
MMASRGMGAISPEKILKNRTNVPKKGKRKDGCSFDTYGRGGEVKSKVNEAGNYTKPSMRKGLFEKIKGQEVQGTKAGQWSGRKAQLLAKEYKKRGGGYRD